MQVKVPWQAFIEPSPCEENTHPHTYTHTNAHECTHTHKTQTHTHTCTHTHALLYFSLTFFLISFKGAVLFACELLATWPHHLQVVGTLSTFSSQPVERRLWQCFQYRKTRSLFNVVFAVSRSASTCNWLAMCRPIPSPSHFNVDTAKWATAPT